MDELSSYSNEMYHEHVHTNSVKHGSRPIKPKDWYVSLQHGSYPGLELRSLAGLSQKGMLIHVGSKAL
jgi:hypothetical protein